MLRLHPFITSCPFGRVKEILTAKNFFILKSLTEGEGGGRKLKKIKKKKPDVTYEGSATKTLSLSLQELIHGTKKKINFCLEIKIVFFLLKSKSIKTGQVQSFIAI